jgi:hypothetical protein
MKLIAAIVKPFKVGDVRATPSRKSVTCASVDSDSLAELGHGNTPAGLGPDLG